MSVDLSKSHRAMDKRQHRESYSAFLKLTVATVVVCILTLVGMALFLT